MTVREYKLGGNNNPLGNLVGILILVMIFVAIFFIARGIFTLLSWAAPVLLILSLIIDYTVTLDFIKFLGRLFKNNWLTGILAVLLTIVGFPIVAGFLFFRSLVKKKITGMMKNESEKEVFTDYEEVEDEDFLELPELEKPKQDPDNEYDDLFK